MEDSSISGPAPYKGMLVACRGMSLVEAGPKNKGGNILTPPNLTTPQRPNAWSPPGGGIKPEGEKNVTILKN